MPKLSNGHRQASSGSTSSSIGTVGQRLSRRANGVEDPKRMKLLADILEESSSPLLNDISSQQLGPRQVAENHLRLFDLLEQLRQLESNLNPELPTRDEESWRKFFDWVDSNSESKISTQVGVSRLEKDDELKVGQQCIDKKDEEEYSLVAKVPMKNGEKIFSISRGLMLSTETAAKDLDLNEFIKKDSIAPGMQNVVLVLHLLNEYSKKEQSQWMPYLNILPRKILPVLKLNKITLARYLLASSHIYEALKLLRSIARQYSYYYQRLHSTRLPLRKDFTFEYYAWGVSCVCSRQNEIPLGGPTSREPKFPGAHHNAHALIPVLDMCNHDSSSNQAIFLDDSSFLIAGKDLCPGDEITINYGGQSRSSGEFYIHNGSVPSTICQQPVSMVGAERSGRRVATSGNYDAVPMTIGLSKQSKLYEMKAKLLKILNMPMLGRFKLILNNYENRHKRDPHLTMFLIVFSMNEQELEFTLNAPNPVGVADEIYEYVQYKHGDKKGVESCGEEEGEEGEGNGGHQQMMGAMKRRLVKSVHDYMVLRAQVSMALIDRTIEEAERRAKEEGEAMDLHAIRLLRCERRIYGSYT